MTEREPVIENDEVSTRNCFHGKVHGDRVVCSKHSVDFPLGMIIKRKALYKPCNTCPDLDCNWE